jgi:5-formyltetrahydrofolate cyclo-ligase
MPPDEKSRRDAEMLKRISETEAYNSCRTLLAYISTKDEADTAALIRLALSEKKTVAAPRWENGGRMTFHIIASLDQTELSGFSEVRRPVESRPEWSPREDGGAALCIVPALAYDKEGFRLGYGKGCYDRFMSENADNGVLYMGVCYREFMIESLPRGGHDMPVDTLIVV